MSDRHEIPADELALLSLSAKLLFENGQTTQMTMSTVTRLAATLGHRALIVARWDEIRMHLGEPGDDHLEIVDAAAAGVDMHKVDGHHESGRRCMRRAASMLAPGAIRRWRSIVGYPPVGACALRRAGRPPEPRHSA